MAKTADVRARVTSTQKDEITDFWKGEGWNNESEFLIFAAFFYKTLREHGFIENQREK